MRLEIESLGGGGRGVSRAGGKVWFVAGALPGEVVEARIERQRAGVVEAHAAAVSAPSPWREANPCPVAAACGGCDLAHVRRDSIVEALRQAALGALRHAPPALALAVREAPVVVSPMGWRLRARLHWDARRRVLGFFGPRSHRTVEITPCRVVSPLLLRTLPALAGALGAMRAGDGDIEWLEDLDGPTAIAGWRGEDAPLPRVGELAGWHRLGHSGAPLQGGWGEVSVTMGLPIPLRVPIGAFFQGNRHLVPRLFDRVGELARELGQARAVDLFGGVGFLGAAARHAGMTDVTTVEANPVAAAAARENLPGADVLAISAEEYLEELPVGAGLLAIVDPPRGGLSGRAMEGLLHCSPVSIILLACDVACFGRDAARLLRGGYRLASVELWDLFAGSHHVEVLASLRRD